MAWLSGTYSSRGIAIYGICSDPEVSADSAARYASSRGLDFPILLDPSQLLARQLDARVTPAAYLLATDGQVLYRGRINDHFSADGERRSSARSRELENAVEAVLADESPDVSETEPFGSPLAPRPHGRGKDETITFTRHVAAILWRNCARCHRPGAVAPFPLLTYKDAVRRADFICDVVSSGQMPPWKPHSGAGVFREASRLSPLEIERLERWAQMGVPKATRPTCPRCRSSPTAGNSASPTSS